MAAKLPQIPEAWKEDRANDIESVTSGGSPPASDGAKWEVKAYFTNPRKLGWTAHPQSAVHGGIKIYRDGKFVYSIDAGPQIDRILDNGTLGNLVFNRSPDSLSTNDKSILADRNDNGEIALTPPVGVSQENFAQALLMAARSYDDSLPYSLPPAATVAAPDPSFPLALAGTHTGRLPYGVQNHMEPNTYNSNSFLAGLLANVGAGSNIDAIKHYVARKDRVAPGIENPIPRNRFRNW